ncbi:MAG: CHAD domain-containing protein [Leptolyngbya sp. Prado105]|jgi:CHAD domain-containing protein|nr:CHAD domain-containing protein [Leptolyngbya sp. Prado105]
MNIHVKPRSETLSHFAYCAIEKHFNKSVKHEAEVLADQDPEALHQMRVGLRRLRTAIQVFGFAADLPKAASEAKIRKFARILGAVRDSDVLRLELISQLGLPESEQKVLKRSMQKLQKQRSRDFKKLTKTLKSKQYRTFRQEMENWLALPCYQTIGQLPIQDVLPDVLMPLIHGILLHPAWLIGLEDGRFAPITAESIREQLQQNELLHDLRKQMKRVRYQTELFTELYGEDYKAQVENFRALQEILGQIQDTVILQSFLNQTLDQPIEKTCPIFADRLQEKIAIAWENWRSQQEQYLDASFRVRLRQTFLKPI